MADFRAGQVLRAADLNDLAQPGIELIEELNLASDDTFTSIPQDFRHLQVRLYGGISGSTQDVAMRINDDSDANYFAWRHAVASDGDDDNLDEDIGAIHVATWHGVSSRQHCVINIHDYAGSHFQGVLTEFGAVGAEPPRVGQVAAWRPVAEPIGSLGFFVIGGGNSFSAQTVASLYGLR